MEERRAESVDDPSKISTTSLVKVWKTTNWPNSTAKNRGVGDKDQRKTDVNQNMMVDFVAMKNYVSIKPIHLGGWGVLAAVWKESQSWHFEWITQRLLLFWLEYSIYLRGHVSSRMCLYQDGHYGQITTKPVCHNIQTLNKIWLAELMKYISLFWS